MYAKTEKKMEDMQITSALTWIEVCVFFSPDLMIRSDLNLFPLGPIHEESRRRG